MKVGDRIKLSQGTQVRHGVVILASPNSESLMVELQDGFTTSKGGVYVDMMPLLFADGEYYELMDDTPVDVRVILPV